MAIITKAITGKYHLMRAATKKTEAVPNTSLTNPMRCTMSPRYPVHGPLNLVCQVVEVWIVKLADRYSIECEDELLLHFRGEVIEKIPVRKLRQ